MIPFIVTALTWLGRIGLAAFAVNEVKNLFEANRPAIEQSTSEAKAAGVTDDELKKIAAATAYDQVEQKGKSPDEFWGNLSQAEQDALKFSPESLRASMQRTEFLGISQTLLWVSAGVAAGVAGFRGIPILLSTLAKLSTARKAGASALSLMTIIEEGKIAGIAKVWIPGLIAGIASAGGWLTGGLTNNLNDALLWGRVFLDQAHDDIEKAAKAKSFGTGTGAAVSPEQVTRTRITISKTAEPKVAVGTIFQSIVKNMDAFKRVLDDQITSPQDLKTDVQLNLNKWLATLPGRLHYEIRIVLNPLDDTGNKLLGTWAMLMIGHRNSQGVFQHLQAIPLGPIEPTIYRPTTKEIETIQVDIPRLLTSEEIINLDLPTTGLRTVDRAGNVTPLSFAPQSPTPVVPGTTTPPGGTATPTPVGESPAAPLTDAEKVQQGLLKPYIRAGYDGLTFARLTGRWIPKAERATIAASQIEEIGHDPSQWPSWKFSNGRNLVEVYNENRGAIAPELTMYYPQYGIGGGVIPTSSSPSAPTPPPVTTPSQPTPTQPITTPTQPYPYVRYLGSPNVFDRMTGRWIPESEANSLNIFTKGLVFQFSVPRPEVKVASDYSVWNNRNLSNYPV